MRRAWLRWKYWSIGPNGSLRIDFRWYVETGAWQRAMEALEEFPGK